MAEQETPFHKIRQLQVRIRTKNPPSDPGEDTQCLVFLEDMDGFFFVKLKGAEDLTMEVELMALLRNAFIHGKQVRLGYRDSNGNRYISAAWVRN